MLIKIFIKLKELRQLVERSKLVYRKNETALRKVVIYCSRGRVMLRMALVRHRIMGAIRLTQKIVDTEMLKNSLTITRESTTQFPVFSHIFKKYFLTSIMSLERNH